jgi:hypothetical protein
LNGVVGMSDLLATTPLSPDQADYVTALQECTGTLASFINDILDLSKLEAGRVELCSAPFDLDELLASTAMTVQSKAEARGLPLRVEYPALGACRLQGDSLRLRQILLNLLSNAIKVTASGSVRLGATLGTPGPDGWPIAFHVTDSGPGIPAARMNQIFEAFRQLQPATTPDEPGTGLGLTIASRLTSLMGANMQVESTLGEGTSFSFTVTCPALDAPSSGPSPLQEQHWWIGGDPLQLPAIGQLLADRWGAELTIDQTTVTGAWGEGGGLVWLTPAAPAAGGATSLPANAVVLAPLGQVQSLRQALPDGITILPMPVRPAALLAALRSRLRSLPSTASLQVALIDENPVSARITGSMLERLGCKLVGAAARDWPDTLDVIVWSCDPAEPAAGHPDVHVRRWLMQHPEVPLVLLVPAGRAAVATAHRRVLSRPVTLRELGDAIQDLTAGSRTATRQNV